ncbi:MAG: 3-hydroxyacyl-CoA dehydrogenase PaaH [Halopseudomonas sp.]
MNSSSQQNQALPKSCIVGVIGAGTMGAGIAQVAANSAHTVILFDQSQEAVQRGLEFISSGLQRQVKRGKLTEPQRQSILDRIRPVTEIDALADCGLVIEAIVENLKIKQGLLAELEALCASDCILASNTSSISITALAAQMSHPERLVGMHFFNPAPVMKLVEVISGIATAPQVAHQVHATATEWGKLAVHAKSSPGFIVNRVARPFYAEALRIVEEGATDIATLDALVREAGGFRMGPFELMDLIGHDINYSVTCSVFEAYYQDPRFLPSLLQKALVDSGRLGRKSGQGFYSYADGAETVTPDDNLPSYAAPASIKVYGDLGVAEPLIERAASAGISVECLPIDGQEAFIEIGTVRLFLTDGRFAAERAATTRHANLAVFDLARDYSTSKRLAVAFADQSDDETRQATIGLFQALGITISILDDIPGLVLMRTVAMLANEACDAVNQGVCSVADADRAMIGGVNYPLGPLAWSDQIGTSSVFNCLNNLQQSYGEDRYRPSPLLRRMHFSGSRFHD